MISPSLARMLAQEHSYRPLTGTVLTLGRQAVSMTPAEAVEILRAEGVQIPTSAIEATREMIETRTRFAAGKGWITDRGFFRLLGVEEVVSLDVADYEGCDIVHNLNLPVPDELVGKYDFIVDGGTFDHLVDLRVCFQNVIRMLKPCGRVFQWNAASNFTGAAYVSFGPDMFFDYYMVNGFVDCKSYVAESDDIGQRYDWDLYLLENPIRYRHFKSPRIQMVIVMAEKGQETIYDRMPVQSYYRTPELVAEFEPCLRSFSSSQRPVWRGRPFVPEPAPTVEAPEPAGIRGKLRSLLTGQETLERPASPVPMAFTPTAAPEGFRYIGRL